MEKEITKTKNTTPLNKNDLNEIIISIMKKGYARDNIDSGNNLMEKGTGLEQLITSVFETRKLIYNVSQKNDDASNIDHIELIVNMNNVRYRKPTTLNIITSEENMLMPKQALHEDKSYSAGVFVGVEIKAILHKKDGTKISRSDSIEELHIANIPIIVGTKLCNTVGLSRDTLIKLGEDPDYQGGNCIAKGNEWVLSSIENITINLPRFFRNRGYKNEVAYMEKLSKPGDGVENSTRLFIKLLNNDCLTIIIDRAPLDTIHMPFYLLLRILGISSDKMITDYVLKCEDKGVRNKMFHILRKAFLAKYANFEDNIRDVHEKNILLRTLIPKLSSVYGVLDLSDEKTVQMTNNKILKLIDIYLLPHIGLTIDSRHEKAICLMDYIFRLLMVELRIYPETDRDSMLNKRVHTSGICLAKVIKQHYNVVIVQAIKKQFTSQFATNTFERVNLSQVLRAAVNSAELERSLIQAIVIGAKQQVTVKNTVFNKQQIVNKLASRQQIPKNCTEIVAMDRSTVTPNFGPSTKSDRSHEMRMIHPDTIGYYCVIQTNNGENVGLNKSLAVSAHITVGSSSSLIKMKIANDPDFIPLTAVKPEHMSKLSHIKVNGHWIGFVKNPHEFATKYRKLRRANLIDKFTTIHWDTITNELFIWVDNGRLTRPLLIVYSNAEEFDEGKVTEFNQYIKVDEKIIQQLKSGEIDEEYLIKNGIAEYISADEQVDTFIAIDHDLLWDNRDNDMKRFTHCDIPIALFGYVALETPFPQYSQAVKTLHATQQGKQAIGWYSKCWADRMDRNAVYMYRCEYPIVQTIINKFLPPNGQNVIMAIMAYGYNQEDSIIMNEGSLKRGLFNSIIINFEKSELEKGETFGNPDLSMMTDIKPNVSYEKIIDGVPAKGTIIEKNDVIIGKYMLVQKNGEKKYVDKSVIYRENEPAYVINCIKARNQEGKPIVKVLYYIIRPCMIGDKFTMRNGQKGVISAIIDEALMPFTKDGITPDIIFSVFSFPSRMTNNALLEATCAKAGVLTDTIIDGTAFVDIDIDHIQKILEEKGYNPDCTEKLYSGIDGKWIDADVLIAPMFYMRINKLATVSGVANSPIDPITRQPADGSAKKAKKIGEMEKDVCGANGIGRFTIEKMADHSDGYAMYICRVCGNQAIVNHKLKKYDCNHCNNSSGISKVNSTWSAMLFANEMKSSGYGVKYKLEDDTFPQ